MEKEKKQGRREFMINGLMGGGLLVSIGLFISHGLSFIFPGKDEKKQRKLLVGKVDELKEGEAKEVTYGENDLFLVRTADGFKVFSAICTHLGCKIKWQDYRNQFYCACHKGFFSANGDVISGPPPRALDQFKVEVDKNLVYMWIDESNKGLA
ncbi:MAG: Rieske (2Fe-2S) protein [Ignavibacteriae bacterium]|nr:Rieske (2Fe-2S) protein [Ignavibacteriota bacterium]NOG96429.1 Rieske (2Fe-2S) protein [Ignavibacteriota bacterium]